MLKFPKLPVDMVFDLYDKDLLIAQFKVAFQIALLDESTPCRRENLKDQHRSVPQFEMNPLENTQLITAHRIVSGWNGNEQGRPGFPYPSG